jgi:hypothetical protein
VLVKDQTSGSENGIYVVGATPVRAFDMDQDLATAVPAEEIAGAFVWVLAGTVNAGKLFHTTNTGGGTIGSTTITWTEFSAGTVTSVALTAPAEFSVSGSPVTGAGTLAITKANESANTVWAGPTSGSAAAPAFRALVAADIPAGVGTHYEPLTSGDSSAPELVFTADGRCVMVPVSD